MVAARAQHWRVFAQGPLDLSRVIQNARRYFELTLEVLTCDAEREDDARRARLLVTAPGLTGELALLARDATARDHEEALAAEARGQAAGMGLLAARCPRVWELAAPGGGEALLLAGSAMLASVALGPVLPADGSTLLGVNSARRRWERHRASEVKPD